MGLFSSHADEALTKKDDDRKPGSSTKKSKGGLPTHAPWTPSTRAPPRKTLKRLGIAVAVALFVYLFIQGMPTDVGIRDRRRPIYHNDDVAAVRGRPGTGGRKVTPTPGAMPKLKPHRKPDRPKAPPPPHEDEDEDDQQRPLVGQEVDIVPAAGGRTFDGPILFRKLAATLQAISDTQGYQAVNKNVLFAAASLKSASVLLPMACEMGAELRSYVHFALLGGSEIGMEELRAVNGIDESCQVIFHDGRPDYAGTSTPARLKKSSARALHHIHSYMHPQAMFVDVSGEEEESLLGGVRQQAPVSGIPLIELPANAHSHLPWISKLDSSSLAAWHKVNFEILIHAAPKASGSLTRLLRSLSAADFSAGAVPHLTIELPHDLDLATKEFLKGFYWPPARADDPSLPSQLTLRHRIPRTRLTEEESAVRFLESFWPADPQHSHVLVLSSQVELSPKFFHYLRYTTLEYLHSKTAQLQQYDTRLLGISLDLPTTYLNTSDPFTAPAPIQKFNKSNKKSSSRETTSAPFLWQSPNSNAMLYLGTKWTELHALVSNLIELQHSSKSLSPFFTDKVVSKRYPAWLEHALSLTRVRGYWALYPGEDTARGLATVHGELARVPEEYEREVERDLIRDSSRERSSSRAGGGGHLMESLDLPPFSEMPLLLYNGNPTDLYNLDAFAADYAYDFRKAVGGCEGFTSEELSPRADMGDLFCFRSD
ncbi:hypothetical protein QBC35DRAFT_371239 [Podospora australis]|uniref:Glycosyltransferase 2 n=1 Tax=Podospora australis TaxID=1536484 RepID=A0AAN6X6G8_9PEZI|nr:hypothetical protein QBC35DRAFT_371239 [Podospora australis]